MSSKASHDIGWIGLGRMGEAMAARLVKAGHGLSVWNRTASKADPLAQIGAQVVTDKAAMAHCATVFTMVSTTDDLKDILFGKAGVLSGNARPKRVVDMSSISDTGSVEIRKGLTTAGVAYLSAPVSGNAKVAKAGKLRTGVQIMAMRNREDLCLDAGEVIEAAEGVVTPVDPASS